MDGIVAICLSQKIDLGNHFGLFKNDAQINAEQVEKLTSNSYQNGIKIDTKHNEQSMPKQVANTNYTQS